MEKLIVFFVLGLVLNGVVCRPQVNNNEDLDDRYGQLVVMDAQGNFIPMQGQFQLPEWAQPIRPVRPVRPGQQTTTTTAAPTGSGTPSATDLSACLRVCPVTSEYNPVCGTNNQVYDNPGRLECARQCGVTVNLLRAAPCPPATPAPAS